MQKVTPFLWFDGHAEAAAKLYVSTFKRGKILDVSRWGKGTPAKPGSVMSVTITIEGQRLILFNGGPHYALSPAFSLFVDCQTQREVDALWKKLTKGGQEQPCGWLTDRYGVSWQIIPRGLMALMQEPAAMQAMFKMTKIDLAALERAAGRPARRSPKTRTKPAKRR